MKIVHSNIEEKAEAAKAPHMSEFAMKMAVKRYQRTCKKHADRIAEIQKHFPGWMPEMSINKAV